MRSSAVYNESLLPSVTQILRPLLPPGETRLLKLIYRAGWYRKSSACRRLVYVKEEKSSLSLSKQTRESHECLVKFSGQKQAFVLIAKRCVGLHFIFWRGSNINMSLGVCV